MKSSFRLPLVLLLMLFVTAACSSPPPPPTATPTTAPTNTPLPTSTSTPEPTQTPLPTATEVPPTPTFVPVGFPAVSDEYEVTVVYARYFEKISSGGFIYTPSEPGGQFLDVSVVIKNLSGQARSVSWQDVYIIDPNGDGWYPNFGGSLISDKDESFDPTTLYLYPYRDLETLVFNDETLYLRAVWASDGQRPATYLFGFDTSNITEITLP